MQLKEPQPGKIATTGQLGKVVRELNSLGQAYGASAGGKAIASFVIPVRVDSVTAHKGFYNLTRYMNPRYPDSTGAVAEIDLGQPITGAIGIYAAEIASGVSPLKADGTEYAAGVFMHNDESGKPVYLLLMGGGGTSTKLAIITDDSLPIMYYKFKLASPKVAAYDIATDGNLNDYYELSGSEIIGINRAESGKAEHRLSVGDFVEVTLDAKKTTGDALVYRMNELQTGCET